MNEINNLKGTRVFINGEYSREALAKRKDLWEQVKKLRQSNKCAILIYNEIVTGRYHKTVILVATSQ